MKNLIAALIVLPGFVCAISVNMSHDKTPEEKPSVTVVNGHHIDHNFYLELNSKEALTSYLNTSAYVRDNCLSGNKAAKEQLENFNEIMVGIRFPEAEEFQDKRNFMADNTISFIPSDVVINATKEAINNADFTKNVKHSKKCKSSLAALTKLNNRYFDVLNWK